MAFTVRSDYLKRRLCNSWSLSVRTIKDVAFEEDVVRSKIRRIRSLRSKDVAFEEDVMKSKTRRVRSLRWFVVLCAGIGLFLQGCSSNNTNANSNNTNANSNNNKANTNNNNANTNNTNANTAPGPISPLSSTTLLYIHSPKNDGVGHVYAYDTSTKKSRLITDLGNKTRTPRVSISPDRKWFALRAFFRPNATDLKQGISIPSLWVVSVDGKQFRRVTEPILNSNGKGASCTVNSQCPSTGYCNTSLGKCSLRNYTIGLGIPRWSRDGKTLWTTLATHWSNGTRLTGGSTLASVPVSGGALNAHAASSGCAQVSHISLHPTEDKILAIHSVCSNGKPGLHMYNIPPTTATQVFFNANISVSLGSTLFFPNGAGILFLANTTWDTNNDGKADAQGIGIAAYDLTKKKLAPILPPLKSHLSYTDMTISPDGKQIVMCIYNSQRSSSSLFILDANDKKTPFKALIDDGKSCYPTW